MEAGTAGILGAAQELRVEIIHILVHALHAEAFQLVHPPRLGLHGLMEIHAVVKVVAQGHAHDPQSAGTKMFLHILDHRRQVAFVDVFHDFPVRDDIKLQGSFAAGKFS